jgi:hypothetical protein
MGRGVAEKRTYGVQGCIATCFLYVDIEARGVLRPSLTMHRAFHLYSELKIGFLASQFSGHIYQRQRRQTHQTPTPTISWSISSPYSQLTRQASNSFLTANKPIKTHPRTEALFCNRTLGPCPLLQHILGFSSSLATSCPLELSAMVPSDNSLVVQTVSGIGSRTTVLVSGIRLPCSV